MRHEWPCEGTQHFTFANFQICKRAEIKGLSSASRIHQDHVCLRTVIQSKYSTARLRHARRSLNAFALLPKKEADGVLFAGRIVLVEARCERIKCHRQCYFKYVLRMSTSSVVASRFFFPHFVFSGTTWCSIWPSRISTIKLSTAPRQAAKVCRILRHSCCSLISLDAEFSWPRIRLILATSFV